MVDSILISTKKVLGIASDYTDFDVDIIMHINSVLSTLNQIGVGPIDGFAIEDTEATWNDFLLGDKLLNSVKTYVGLKVRLLFDPPATSFTIAAWEKQIAELEWRLNVTAEIEKYPVSVLEGSSSVSTPVVNPLVFDDAEFDSATFDNVVINNGVFDGGNA